MRNMNLYNANSNEFSELIDNAKVRLKTRNFKYKKLIDASLKILNNFPNLQLFMEGDAPEKLNKIECKMLKKLVSLHMQISDFEDQEIFFLGGKEFYLYLKNMHII